MDIASTFAFAESDGRKPALASLRATSADAFWTTGKELAYLLKIASYSLLLLVADFDFVLDVLVWVSSSESGVSDFGFELGFNILLTSNRCANLNE